MKSLVRQLMVLVTEDRTAFYIAHRKGLLCLGKKVDGDTFDSLKPGKLYPVLVNDYKNASSFKTRMDADNFIFRLNQNHPDITKWEGYSNE